MQTLLFNFEALSHSNAIHGYDKPRCLWSRSLLPIRARCTFKQELIIHCDKLFDMKRPDAIGIQKADT